MIVFGSVLTQVIIVFNVFYNCFELANITQENVTKTEKNDKNLYLPFRLCVSVASQLFTPLRAKKTNINTICWIRINESDLVIIA